MPKRDVAGRAVVVTGASRGLGAGLARTFYARGMRLALCARGPCVLAGKKDVFTAEVDVSREQSIEAFARAAVERFGPIDLWINNAGQLEPVKPVRRTEFSEFQRNVEVNLFGVFLGSRVFARLHREVSGAQGRDAVLINVSSGAAVHGYAGWGAYCASKAAVDRLTECLQLEEADTGLRCYAVAPGVIDTAMQEHIRSRDPADFPAVSRFQELKQSGAYNRPEFVAEQLLAYAFDPECQPAAVVVRVPNEG